MKQGHKKAALLCILLIDKSARLRNLLAGNQRRDRAGGNPCRLAIGPACQNDRHARAEHDAGGVGMGEEGEVLGQHVAGLEVGHDEPAVAVQRVRLAPVGERVEVAGRDRGPRRDAVDEEAGVGITEGVVFEATVRGFVAGLLLGLATRINEDADGARHVFLVDEVVEDEPIDE